MKHVFFLIATILLSVTTVVCKIWVIVSFLIYLVKDTPFNWTVLWIGLISLFALIVVYVLSLFSEYKRKPVQRFDFSNENSGRQPSKSKFAQRLEEAQRLQAERNKN